MHSFLVAENRTLIPAITICASGVEIFRDILIGDRTDKKILTPGSQRLEIYDNFMRPITVCWVPLVPYKSVCVCVYDDYISISQ
ncbi:MAG: hypothetical protein Q4B31_03425 [Clostridia bacterium]|nr:hypothetical protein [Clostridia bacterium]